MGKLHATELQVRVQPGASRENVAVSAEGVVKLKVTVPPVKGKANDAAVALLAKHLGVARRQVRIVRGQRWRNKVVVVDGLYRTELLGRLQGGTGPTSR